MMSIFEEHECVLFRGCGHTFNRAMKKKNKFQNIVHGVNLEALMYQSIPILTIPPGQTPGEFLKGRIPHPRAQRMCKTPTRGRKIVLTPNPPCNYFKKSSKTVLKC